MFEREDGGHASSEWDGFVGGQRDELGGARRTGAAAFEFKLRVKVLLLAWANEQLKQLHFGEFVNVRERSRFEVFRHKLHYITDIRATIGEFAAMPTGDIHAAAGIHIDVSRATNGQESLLMRVKGSTVGGRVVAEHRAAAPVAGVHGVAKGCGPAGVVVKHTAAARATAIILERGHDLGVKIFIPRRIAILPGLHDVAKAHIPTTTVVCVIAREHVEVRVDTRIEDVT